MDKTEGITSHDVVARVRRALGMKRVGHAGTLDPFATGLLIVLVGRATRLCRFMTGLRKQYAGTVRLGQATDTDDSTGALIREDESWQVIEDDVLERSVGQLIGRYPQEPPAYSARKVRGQRAYRLARKGEVVELKPREVEVSRFEITAREGRDLSFLCDVSGGTYIRAMARDLGRALGCGAHLHALRRLSVGGFKVEDAVSADQISEGMVIDTPARAIAHLPRMELDTGAVELVRHGRPIHSEGEEGTVALIHGDELIAVAERRHGSLKVRVVLEG